MHEWQWIQFLNWKSIQSIFSRKNFKKISNFLSTITWVYVATTELKKNLWKILNEEWTASFLNWRYVRLSMKVSQNKTELDLQYHPKSKIRIDINILSEEFRFQIWIDIWNYVIFAHFTHDLVRRFVELNLPEKKIKNQSQHSEINTWKTHSYIVN